MTSPAAPAGYLNLATLSPVERSAIEQHKKDCLGRYHAAKNLASLIYSGLSKRGRIWAEKQLMERPDIEKAARVELNILLRKKK